MKKIFNLFVIMMITISASAADLDFTVDDNWTTDYAAHTASCTKEGITLTLVGSQSPIFLIEGVFSFGMEGSATITVDMGTVSGTVTGISTLGSNLPYENFDLTGAGPWTCPIDFGQIKKDEQSSPIQVKGFTVHVDLTSGVQSVKSTSARKAGKFLKGGKLVIAKDGKQYNIAGQKM